MKWFKHFTDAYDDEDITAMIEEFGIEGYGRWWLIVETVAKQMDETDKCSVIYPWRKWEVILHTKRNKLRSYLVATELLMSSHEDAHGKQLEIKIPKLLELRDNHTKNLQVTCK